MQEPPFLPLLRALRALHLDGTVSHEGQLSAAEAAWLSGYFAALARDPGQREEFARTVGLQEQRPSASGAAQRVNVLFATETGNARGVAKQLSVALRAAGLTVETLNLADYDARTLETEHTVVIVTSTHGDGTPPEPAARFFEGLTGPRAPRSLARLRFAVLGLGDSSYEHFCRAAKVLDQRLAELGAERMIARVDCDVDYADQAARFTQELVALLGAAASARAEPSLVPAIELHQVAPPRAPARPAYDKSRPYDALVLENQALTGRGSSKEVRHIALELGNSGLTFMPGDALGVCAPNQADVVDGILGALALAGDEQVSHGSQRLTLRSALTGQLDVTVPSARLLELLTEQSRSEELRSLMATDDEGERRRFLRAHHVLDLVQKYRARDVSPQALVSALRPLAPRLYSIASSQAAVPEEVHLTVSVVRYQQHGRHCLGVASGHIAEQAGEGKTLRVYVHANPSFRLPRDKDTPIVMIGAGTGVAPYRAFLQQRTAQGARGRAWLFFGERNFRTDFLYQTEWQAWLRKGALERLSVAFSRDQANKMYVQQRLAEHGRDVYDWLEAGAHVYLCGDAQGMAPAVHETLLDIVERQRGSRDRARDYLHELRDQHRYQRDVY